MAVRMEGVRPRTVRARPSRTLTRNLTVPRRLPLLGVFQSECRVKTFPDIQGLRKPVAYESYCKELLVSNKLKRARRKTQDTTAEAGEDTRTSCCR